MPVKVYKTREDQLVRDKSQIQLALLRGGYSLKNTSRMLGISPITLKKKLDEPKLFLVSEVLILAGILDLTKFQVFLLITGQPMSNIERIGAEAHKKVIQSAEVLSPVKDKATNSDWP